jgi:hypothetical protein
MALVRLRSNSASRRVCSRMIRSFLVVDTTIDVSIIGEKLVVTGLLVSS